MESFLYVYERMGKIDFQFQNKEQCQSSKRKEILSENWIKKFLVFSSFTVFLCFFALKFLWFFNLNKSYPYLRFNKLSSEEKNFEKAYILPLLVNLKGENGPQLVKAQVYITLSEDSLEEDFLSQNKEFEKHLLFILSGQEIKTLQKKRNYFEQQIRSQLNVFLSRNTVDGVRIQTEKLN